MWDFISQKIRFGQGPWRRKEDTQEKMQARSLKMKRVSAQIRLVRPMAGLAVESIPEIPVQLLLNDFSPNGIRLFSPVAFSVGDSVALMIDAPRSYYVRGRVVSCQNAVMNPRVLQANPVPYRLVIKFDFGSEREFESARQFYSEIQILVRDPSVAKAA